MRFLSLICPAGSEFLQECWAAHGPKTSLHSPPIAMAEPGSAWVPRAGPLHLWAALSTHPSVRQMLFSMCAMMKKNRNHCARHHLSGTLRREFLTWVGAYIRQQMWGPFPLRPRFLTVVLLYLMDLNSLVFSLKPSLFSSFDCCCPSRHSSWRFFFFPQRFTGYIPTVSIPTGLGE